MATPSGPRLRAQGIEIVTLTRRGLTRLVTCCDKTRNVTPPRNLALGEVPTVLLALSRLSLLRPQLDVASGPSPIQACPYL